jgi:hypothetical protein
MVEIYSRDLKGFGQENVNYWVIETGLVDSVAPSMMDKIIVNELLRPRKMSSLQLQRFNKRLYVRMADKPRFHVALTKGLYKKLAAEQAAANEELTA